MPDVRSSTTIALLGDSHAEHWLGALDSAGRAHGRRISAMVKNGSPVADIPTLPGERRGRWYGECSRYRDAMLRCIVAMRPDAVVLSSWGHYVAMHGGSSRWQVSADEWRAGLRRTYARLAAAGLRTIVTRDVPRAWFDVPACLSRRAAGVRSRPRSETASQPCWPRGSGFSSIRHRSGGAPASPGFALSRDCPPPASRRVEASSARRVEK